jgi:hypothetical protein
MDAEGKELPRRGTRRHEIDPKAILLQRSPREAGNRQVRQGTFGFDSIVSQAKQRIPGRNQKHSTGGRGERRACSKHGLCVLGVFLFNALGGLPKFEPFVAQRGDVIGGPTADQKAGRDGRNSSERAPCAACSEENETVPLAFRY